MSTRHVAKYHVWRFIDVNLRSKILELDNENVDISKSHFSDDIVNENRFLGLLVNEVDFLEHN